MWLAILSREIRSIGAENKALAKPRRKTLDNRAKIAQPSTLIKHALSAQPEADSVDSDLSPVDAQIKIPLVKPWIKRRRHRIDIAAVQKLLDAGINHTKAAQLIGCRRETIARIASKLEASEPTPAEQIERRLKLYRKQVRKNLPTLKRAETLAKCVDKVDSNPFAALRTIQYVDQLDGFTPAADNRPESTSRPLIQITGNNVQVNMGPQPVVVGPESER